MRFNRKILSQAVKTIMRQELDKKGIEYQAVHANVLPLRTVGVQGDVRTYTHPVEIYVDTAEKRRVYEECAEKISTRITNEVNGINHVAYLFAVKKSKT